MPISIQIEVKWLEIYSNKNATTIADHRNGSTAVACDLIPISMISVHIQPLAIATLSHAGVYKFEYVDCL